MVPWVVLDGDVEKQLPAKIPISTFSIPVNMKFCHIGFCMAIALNWAFQQFLRCCVSNTNPTIPMRILNFHFSEMHFYYHIHAFRMQLCSTDWTFSCTVSTGAYNFNFMENDSKKLKHFSVMPIKFSAWVRFGELCSSVCGFFFSSLLWLQIISNFGVNRLRKLHRSQNNENTPSCN